MDLHHSKRIIRAERIKSERLGRELLASMDSPMPTSVAPRATVRLIHTYTRKTDLLTGAQTFAWITEAA